MTDVGAQRLIYSILRLASADYLEGRKYQMSHPGKENLSVERKLYSAEIFFYSEWFTALCSMDPNEFIYRLDQKIKKQLREESRRF